MPKDIFKKDPYSVLGVAGDATDKEIYSGYRKKALKCHPDKNPDDPKAAELFHELSKALEILTDVAARAAYDQTIKTKRAAEERNTVLDSKRKKFKEDLEARERAFQEQKKQTQKTGPAGKKYCQQDIGKRKAAGKKYRQQDIERRKKFKENLEARERAFQELKQTQYREAAEKIYHQQEIERQRASARYLEEKQERQRHHQWIEQERQREEEQRLREDEQQLREDPQRLRDLARRAEVAQWKAQNEDYTVDAQKKSDSEYTQSAAEIDIDYETLVLMKMRQAEEKKRLITEQMKKEDTDDE